jgi:ABC-type Fe3+ transport system substrate-binding protein
VVLTALALAACQAPAAPSVKPAAAPGQAPAGQAAPATPGAASDAPSAEVQRLVAAAQAAGETEFGLVWAESTFGGAEGARQFQALFNKLYGTNIRINFTPGPSMPDMAARVTQEVAAGRKTSTDVLIATDSNLAPLLTRDVLEEYDYGALSPRISSDLIAPRRLALEVAGNFPGITYNTDLVPEAEVPRRLEDVLNPKWKGRIASTATASYFEHVAARPEWGAERMKAFVSRLSQQVGGLIRVGETPRIISGEFLMLVLQSGSHQLGRPGMEGAPVKLVIPADGAIAGFWYLGVPRTSGSPNLAKLFLNMIMTEEGQAVLYRVNGADHYALPGSRSVAQLDAVRAQRSDVLKVDAKFFLEHPEFLDLSDDFTRILREGRGS